MRALLCAELQHGRPALRIRRRCRSRARVNGARACLRQFPSLPCPGYHQPAGLDGVEPRKSATPALVAPRIQVPVVAVVNEPLRETSRSVTSPSWRRWWRSLRRWRVSTRRGDRPEVSGRHASRSHPTGSLMRRAMSSADARSRFEQAAQPFAQWRGSARSGRRACRFAQQAVHRQQRLAVRPPKTRDPVIVRACCPRWRDSKP